MNQILQFGAFILPLLVVAAEAVAAPPISGKTIEIDMGGDIYTWVFKNDGSVRVTGGEIGDEGMDAEYEQKGSEIFVTTREAILIGTYDGKTLEFVDEKEIHPLDYEQYKTPYGDDCVEHGGFFRCWDIHVPNGLTGKVPLVIDLHGLSSDPGEQKEMSGFKTLADAEKFIVVWPYGIGKSWNSGKCCEPASEEGIDDVGFIKKMVKQLIETHNIDSKRVYVTGLSNGSAMAQRLASEASDLIAASASMSLYLLIPPDPDYSPVSVMFIHGTDDDVVPYGEGDLGGAIANFNTWKKMNNCTGDYTEAWRSGESYAWTYRNKENGTEVSLVTIDDGGHVLYKGKGTDIDTSRLAWDFMKRFIKP